MPTPVPPDPADRSSVRRATDRTHIRPLPPDDSPTHSTIPNPISEPPTVITGQRSGPRNIDPNLAAGLAGRKLGPFELIEGVGAGGMAAVLRARDADLGRIVALKILPPEMAADPENVVRFKQEARSAARLDHDNVARVYHCGEDQGLYFIAFEFVEGDNLRQVMDAHGGAIPVPDAISIMLQLAAGLAHAAERGVVHRDIKPSNIIITPDGRAKIVDMGLARSLDARHDGHLTQSGVTLGTFDYISPEQAIDPRGADVRSDIYSLGCTFYHALSGHPPVPEGTAAAKLDAQKNVLPPDPRTYNPAIPADLAVILGRMMAKEPDRRYQHPDHLAAHLRGLARKLGLPATLVPLAGPAEDPVPPPPRLSVAWGLTACAVLFLCVVVFTNAFRAPPPLPVWADGPVAILPAEPADPGLGPAAARPSAAVPQPAATVGELVALLQSGAQQIRLTGTEYDLWTYWDDPGHPVDLLLSGDDVRLESDTGAIIVMGFARDVKARAKSLTLRGPAGRGSAVVRGIQFKLVGPADEADIGLLASGFARVHFEDCAFVAYAQKAGPAALALTLHGAEVTLQRCYFGPGGVGVAVSGPGRLTADQCAVASQQAGVRVTRPADATGDTVVTLTHCSTLFADGAVVDVADQVPCIVRAGHCLFAAPRIEGGAVVLRQKDLRASGSRLESAGVDPLPNAYHNVLPYSDGDRAYTKAECDEREFPVRDDERAVPHPWESRDPVAALAGNPPDPRKAFMPDRALPELRVPGDRDRLTFGTQYVGRHQLFMAPLSPPGKDGRDATAKIWDPGSADPPAPGVYRSLKKALADLQKGDALTLLLRHTGPLPVDPVELEEDVSLTIRPDANCKPVLIPTRPGLRRRDGLFKMAGGRLVLDGLQFRLPADRPPAIAVMPGGGQFELRNSVVTFAENGEDLSAVVIADPKNEMMMGGAPREWPVPRVVVENTLLRGKGRLMGVKVSRPFELDVKNTLAVLDGTLIEVEPAAGDPGAGTGVITLTRVTTYLSESLLSLQAGDRKADAPAVGLVKTEVTATQSLFLPAGEAREAFVRTARLDTEDQVRRYFVWRGPGNVYGYDKKKVMLDLRPAEVPMMPAKAIEGDRWLGEFAKDEVGDPFTRVRYVIQPPTAGMPSKFTVVRPQDFRAPTFDPALPEDGPSLPVGVRVDQKFPSPFPE